MNVEAASHCLTCSEWVTGPCSYCACPFRVGVDEQAIWDEERSAARALVVGGCISLAIMAVVVAVVVL